jgi:hypothetical protein
VSERNKAFETARSKNVALRRIDFVRRLKVWRGRG